MSTRFTQNKQNGLLAERIAREDFIEQGFSIKKTGIGSDFIAFKKTPGKKEHQIYVEVKYNKAELSPLQKKKRSAMKKSGIDYIVYRVTSKFMENYKKENGIEDNIISSINLGEPFTNRYIVSKNENFRIILPWKCPNCKRNSASTISELIKNFGLRTMGKNGTVRNQSWCRECR
jgi:hypothetical protein